MDTPPDPLAVAPSVPRQLSLILALLVTPKSVIIGVTLPLVVATVFPPTIGLLADGRTSATRLRCLSSALVSTTETVPQLPARWSTLPCYAARRWTGQQLAVAKEPAAVAT